MRQAKLISITVALVVGLAGCGGEQTPPDAASDPANSNTIKTEDPDAVDGETAEGADGETAVVGTLSTPDPATDGPPPVGSVPLDLITSTNPDTRAQQVQRDRPDPFSLLPASPTVEVRDTGSSGRAGSPGGATGVQTAALPQAGASGSGTTNGGGSPGAAGTSPDGSTTSGESPDGAAAGPPPPPPTTLARAVTVSGVVRIGAVPYAIVQAPNEASSRYVRAGQSLSNGAVLVKRIDASSFEPVVVLEQNGVEVLRNVEGAPPEAEESEVAEAEEAAATS